MCKHFSDSDFLTLYFNYHSTEHIFPKSHTEQQGILFKFSTSEHPEVYSLIFTIKFINLFSYFNNGHVTITLNTITYNVHVYERIELYICQGAFAPKTVHAPEQCSLCSLH